MRAQEHELTEEEPTRDVTGVIPIPIESEREETVRIVRKTRLVCVAGAADLGRSFQLGADPVMIGRGAAQVQLRANDVSRNHARITPSSQDYVIEDLQSSNGTLVNGARIAKPTCLNVGDRIQIGTTILVLTLQDELEERMRQLQRVEAMTAFAGGLAHDFNNTLTIIASGVYLLRDRAKADPEFTEIVDELEQATSDASRLVKRLLRLGRPDPITFERTTLRDIVDRTVAQLRRVASDRIEIVIDVVETLRVYCSQGEIHQVLLNLFINARDAMPEGGRLSVSARPLRLGRTEAAERHVAEGPYVELSVQDTGIGMEESVVARAFEPFFTTKAPGKGTGLGLAMIHQIVRNHGGGVTLTSTPGRGTQFLVLLPAG